MNLKPLNLISKLIFTLITITFLINPIPSGTTAQAAPAGVADTACRFGITSVAGAEGYDIASLHVASYLDWGAVTNPSLPNGVEYIRVLRLRDDLYPETLANLPVWVQANPASVWVVGNEPDTTYGEEGQEQDALLPEVYADRYYTVATTIRLLDSTARIAFGPVVQPTPIRIRYLQRAWERLVADAGSYSAASGLVDIWSPHSFILNEQEYSWGTGIPPGFEGDHADAFIIDVDHFYYTYSIDIFQQHIIAFRSWLAGIGERYKPLWITEYGSLFPPTNQIGGTQYYTVTDTATTDFMLNTFDFMLSANDPQTGLPADGNQLVQRWFWYSLNDHRYHRGGSVYNPDSPYYGDLITHVGKNFIFYQSKYIAQPDLYPADLAIIPISYNSNQTLVNYRLDITIDNNDSTDATCAQVWVYDGNPDSGGTLIAGPLPSSMIRANYGNGLIRVYWRDVLPMEDHAIYVKVEPIGVEDTNLDNNVVSFHVYTALPIWTYLPIIQRR